MDLIKEHMERLSKENLQTLIDHSATPSISLFLPTHEISSEAEQDPIRLKNLLGEVEDTLGDRGYTPLDITDLLAPIHALVDDHNFWRYQNHGLAIYRSADHFEYYRLPINFEEMTYVSDRFYIKPLLPLFSATGHFYLLTLSQSQVELYECTQFRAGKIDLGDDTPTSLDEAMRFDDFESQLQAHTRTRQSTSGDRSAMHYGMSDAGDEAVIKENIKRFLQAVDKGLNHQLADESAPLVLAGVEYMCGLYREVSHYAHIFDSTIDGNPENVPLQELHEAAWQKVEPIFEQKISAAMDNYMHLIGTNDDRASAQLDKAVSAAYFQRIDTLFIPTKTKHWGTFDADANKVERHDQKESNNEDLLDLAAAYSLANGGTVYAIPEEKLPDDAEVAAIFRY